MENKQIKKLFAKTDKLSEKIRILEERSLGRVIFKGEGVELTARELPKVPIPPPPSREYTKWSFGEDKRLERRLERKIKELAKLHGRSVGAIKSRIAKKELIYPYKPW